LFDKTVVDRLRSSSPAARQRDLLENIWGHMLWHVRETETPVLARSLLNLHDIFTRSHTPTGKIPSQSTGTVDTVAAHGFMNLMPELVAALTSNEGGGLLWLGLTPHPWSKDWMHFELRDKPRIDRDSKWETDPPEVVPVPDAISGADARTIPNSEGPKDENK
jgi:hypothetical protein